MKLKTDNGLAEPMPLSDLQVNNRRTKLLAIGIYLMAAVLFLFFLYLVVITGYVIVNDVFNNYVRYCVR